MDRIDYQNLRFSVQSEITNALSECLDADAVTNSVMRLLLQAISAQEVKRQRSNRSFLTFRRNPETIVPGWAFRKSGTESRLPTL